MQINLNRNELFISIVIIIFSIILIYKVIFLITCEHAKGIVKHFHEVYSLNGYEYKEPVIEFNTDSLIIKFTSNENVNYNVGDTVNVVYKEKQLPKAYVLSLFGFWINKRIFIVLWLIIIIYCALFSFISRKEIIQIILNKHSLIKIIKDNNPDFN